jgi:hypothetical protein
MTARLFSVFVEPNDSELTAFDRTGYLWYFLAIIFTSEDWDYGGGDCKLNGRSRRSCQYNFQSIRQRE